jgi:hypothetical protein
VKKLIAGPTVYICNECIEICVEVIESDAEQGRKNTAAVQDYLLRAIDDLESARVLIAAGRRRVGVELSRTSSQSSLMAYELLRDGHVSYSEFDKLVSALLFDDAELRQLEGLNVTPLLKDYHGGEVVPDGEAEAALETARLIYEFVAGRAPHN